MITEIFTVCDYAQEMGGKLAIVGTFDNISTTKMPTTHPLLCLALRLRFGEKELGKHKLALKLISPDKKVLQEIVGEIDVALPVGMEIDYSSFNMVANFSNFQFTQKGKYNIELLIDNDWVSAVPLNLTLKS